MIEHRNDIALPILTKQLRHHHPPSRFRVVHANAKQEISEIPVTSDGLAFTPLAKMTGSMHSAKYWINKQLLRYARDMDKTNAETWVAACAHCLQKHWRTVDPVQLEDVARELLEHQGLRLMEPAEAAELWLRPVAGPVVPAGDRATHG